MNLSQAPVTGPIVVRRPDADRWRPLASGARHGQGHHPGRITRADPPKRAEGAQRAPAPRGGPIRVGISGVPGAGKVTSSKPSALWLIDRGHRVAVLAVDPSSSVSGGPSSATRRAWKPSASARGSLHPPSPFRG